jgi:hypothetical protein
MEESTVEQTNEVSLSTSPPSSPSPKTSRGLHGPSLGIGAGITI